MSWRREYISRVEQSRNDNARLLDCMAAMANELEFEYVSCGLRVVLPVPQPSMAVFGNFPDSWHKTYIEKGFVSHDPTFQHGLNSSLPMVWEERWTNDTKPFWDEAARHGLRYGWTVAMRPVSGCIGTFSFARSQNSISVRELDEKEPRMLWNAHAVLASVSKQSLEQLIPEHNRSLSRREKEVMRLTAEGKTASDIGTILFLTERTINFHVANVMAKLGATNKIQAAIKAVMLGMLSGN
ncbi:LuxR family transcriptional regulator [Trinickia violacea]|uniref:LuxR family transcriptional regulator n=1 Tax=Trinickia violacea TaxID=2571746 RepID=A0A4P8J148_9BURK|nr:LuxR family transcriptional regulator [Trinickia violacea]QCP54517.1 LuxR family transcriptional regulator [Trinickia violacea]